MVTSFDSADNSELWQLCVFCSHAALGNPTGVVFPSPELSKLDYARIAGWLGYPDTIFLAPGTKVTRWTAYAFSPFEELALCIQATLAADAVLRHKHPELGSTELVFDTPSGEVRTARSPNVREPISWLMLPRERMRKGPVGSPMSSLLGAPLPGEYPETVIGMGRKRVYRQFPDAASLADVTLLPSRVMEYCQGNGLNGICLFAVTGPAAIALRVFTTSLGGNEDWATGGAVSGLPWYSSDPDPVLGDLKHGWTVQQGSGPAQHRGTLYLRSLEAENAVAVGGRIRLVASGRLLQSAEDSAFGAGI